MANLDQELRTVQTFAEEHSEIAVGHVVHAVRRLNYRPTNDDVRALYPAGAQGSAAAAYGFSVLETLSDSCNIYNPETIRWAPEIATSENRRVAWMGIREQLVSLMRTAHSELSLAMRVCAVGVQELRVPSP
ncbi:hypothetical protein [Chitinasiproducens palmae]|uniref:hypothetical protein n=1 Tax=Chitinasiproducens palmae TaxID=1770053 RepID=UPI001113D7A6|nr:hypothetical protein [Chitinasiproducens palmae]